MDEIDISECETNVIYPMVDAVVTRCSKLNVRTAPDAEASVLCTVSSGSHVMVEKYPYDDWYAVCTASGIEGFCMKDYIDIL